MKTSFGVVEITTIISALEKQIILNDYILQRLPSEDEEFYRLLAERNFSQSALSKANKIFDELAQEDFEEDEKEKGMIIDIFKNKKE